MSRPSFPSILLLTLLIESPTLTFSGKVFPKAVLTLISMLGDGLVNSTIPPLSML
jgi:hypothetical protein